MKRLAKVRPESPAAPPPSDVEGHLNLRRWHLRLGWGALLVFLLLGLVLETLHGLKADFYLDPRWEVRRTMWRLGHSHGALFALIHIVFAQQLGQYLGSLAGGPLAGGMASWRMASGLLTAGLILLPAGFLCGGVWTYGGDPGMGVFLVPLGALAMAAGVALVALRSR